MNILYHGQRQEQNSQCGFTACSAFMFVIFPQRIFSDAIDL